MFDLRAAVVAARHTHTAAAISVAPPNVEGGGEVGKGAHDDQPMDAQGWIPAATRTRTHTRTLHDVRTEGKVEKKAAREEAPEATWVKVESEAHTRNTRSHTHKHTHTHRHTHTRCSESEGKNNAWSLPMEREEPPGGGGMEGARCSTDKHTETLESAREQDNACTPEKSKNQRKRATVGRGERGRG